MNSSGNIQIREYRSSDKQQILSLIEEYNSYHRTKNVFKRTTPKSGLSNYLANKLLRSIKTKKGKLYVAQIENKIIGFIGVFVFKQSYWETFETEDMMIGYVSKVFIKEEYRNRRAGDKLLTKAEEYFKQIGATHMRLFVAGSNKNAQDFYAKRGYINWNIEMIKKL